MVDVIKGLRTGKSWSATIGTIFKGPGVTWLERSATTWAFLATVSCCWLGQLSAETTSKELRRLPPTDAAATCPAPGQPHEPARVDTVAYHQPVVDANGSESVGNAAPSFQLDLEQNAASRLGNNFTADPEFLGGIIVVRPDTAMKIGGYVKADLIYDFDAIDATDSFDTTSIPTAGRARQNTRFHARQSRLSFDTRWRVGDDVARAFVEADFFGGDPNGTSNFRLRHAYGTLGAFTAGQTWTTFTDPSAVPATLDFEGAVSNVNRRQGLVRWEQPLWDDSLSLAFGVEDARIIIEDDLLAAGEPRTESPDFISRLRVEPDWGRFQAAILLRELGFQPTGQSVVAETAWGLNFTGSVYLLKTTKSYYQITFGDGIGSYRGSPDVVSTGPNAGAILPSFGWMIGVHHEWTERLTSNVTFSELSLDNLPGQDPANLHRTTYLAINLIANPYERLFVGAEYLYGLREDVSGATGKANRLQMSFGFHLP